MKTLHKFLLRSFIGPFAATFCISIFVLLLQFLWLYIDDLVGKGLEWFIISKFLLYVSITLVPMALPLAILLSSLMTFGNLAEHYELVSMKSAGMSLQKIMRPLIIVAIGISALAFYFSNNVLPWASLKMQSLLYDITHSKPTINIKEGTFYNGINWYSIRIGKKAKDGKGLQDVMIYDHRAFMGNIKAAFADSGRMEMAKDKSELVFTLYNGYSYEDYLNNDKDTRTRPMLRNHFREQQFRFNLDEFKMNKTDESLFKGNHQMMNLPQLQEGIDSLYLNKLYKHDELKTRLNNNYYIRSSAYLKASDSTKATPLASAFFYNKIPDTEKHKIVEGALNLARNAKQALEVNIDELKSNQETILKFKIEFHKKMTLSIACLILFFIGAPLGAIIRKGGLGMPVVVSVLFFIIFYVISIMGERLSKEGELEPIFGMWLAPAVLLPIGAYLTYKASTDSPVVNFSIIIDKIKSFRKK